jgi:hypothetical protein
VTFLWFPQTDGNGDMGEIGNALRFSGDPACPAAAAAMTSDLWINLGDRVADRLDELPVATLLAVRTSLERRYEERRMRPVDRPTGRLLVDEYWPRTNAPAYFRDALDDVPALSAGDFDPISALRGFLSEIASGGAVFTALKESLKALFAEPENAPPAHFEAVTRRTLERDDERLTESVESHVDVLLDSDDGTSELLVRFLYRLARLAEVEGSSSAAVAYRRWCRIHLSDLRLQGPELDQVEQEVGEEPISARRHVLLRLRDSDDDARIDAWEYWDGPPGSAPGQQDRFGRSLVLDRLAEAAKADLGAADLDLGLPRSRTDAPNLVVVEVIPTPGQLDLPVETWRCAGEPVGELVPVALRSPAADTRSFATHRRRWTEPWREQRTYPVQKPKDTGYRDGDYLCVEISYPATEAELARVLADACATGVSIAFWDRQAGTAPAQVYTRSPLFELPDRVRQARRDGGNGRYGLLWNNPFWVLDGFELTWRDSD